MAKRMLKSAKAKQSEAQRARRIGKESKRLPPSRNCGRLTCPRSYNSPRCETSKKTGDFHDSIFWSKRDRKLDSRFRGNDGEVRGQGLLFERPKSWTPRDGRPPAAHPKAGPPGASRPPPPKRPPDASTAANRAKDRFPASSFVLHTKRFHGIPAMNETEFCMPHMDRKG